MIRLCEDCRWWDNSVQSATAPSDTTGVCRFNPPRADKRDHSAIWPFTKDGDWCGSFRADEGSSAVLCVSKDGCIKDGCAARGECLYGEIEF